LKWCNQSVVAFGAAAKIPSNSSSLQVSEPEVEITSGR
jgi:hypothetical protein